MFVVVLIKSEKKYIIVPEEWIYDINEELLKNKGVNSNRDVLIFWSQNGVGPDGKPDATYAPNFSLSKSSIYPPPNFEAVYVARIIRYFGR